MVEATEGVRGVQMAFMAGGKEEGIERRTTGAGKWRHGCGEGEVDVGREVVCWGRCGGGCGCGCGCGGGETR